MLFSYTLLTYSLLKVVLHMSEAFHMRLPMNLLFTSPNIVAIARYIDMTKDNLASVQQISESKEEQVDLLIEAHALDSDIHRSEKEMELTPGEIRTVFLTGATGFLGYVTK
jgi:hypothetical protein